ncbi:MAG TPA: Flp pilus assembly protein CpaB [Candidatus Micrarchaeaceae archaeon]|nr:Flp pilus assembly protein CpaB [Candidatus Micrarchaeaceae archaeon]
MRTVTSRRPFTILGIVLALLVIAAFVLVAINASTGNSGPSQNVVVATQDLVPRVPIPTGSLEIKSLPSAGLPSTVFTKISDAQGMIPLVTIVKGEVVSANLVARPGQALGAQSEFLPIPSGYVALAIPTSEQQGVADSIQPGDFISVIATVTSGAKVATKTVFTNIHVILVGVDNGGGTASAATATSLTVVVTQCEAEYITWFLSYASLKYTLESPQDYLTGPVAKDPNCQSVADAKGVTLKLVQQAFPSLF